VKTFGVAETARMLETNIDTIKKWCYLFKTYLSANANPVKGKSRFFTIEDVRVFCYIYLYWEDEPDIECIKMGLNINSQYDNLPIDNTIKALVPVFVPMPNDIDETWQGVVFGGEFELGGFYESANSFKLAGDRLIEIGLGNYEQRDLFQPAMYSYRHALELYLKSVVGQRGHDLKYLLDKLKVLLKKKWSQEVPIWLQNLILSFHSVDPGSTSFRYGITLSKEELYTDMSHIKDLMDWAMQAFTNIKKAGGDTD